MKFRFARHTNRLQEAADFYLNILGFELLGDFKGHSGYDGVFIGKKDLNWEIEFTQTNDKFDHTFDEDDLLVFYPETTSEYNQIQERITKNKVPILKAKNPYWQQHGITIKDPDGYLIVISNLKTEIS